eukprot:1719608-Prymnesium_polylepis.1
MEAAKHRVTYLLHDQERLTGSITASTGHRQLLHSPAQSAQQSVSTSFELGHLRDTAVHSAGPLGLARPFFRHPDPRQVCASPPTFSHPPTHPPSFPPAPPASKQCSEQEPEDRTVRAHH